MKVGLGNNMKDILKSKTREKILVLMYDEKPRSAYLIAKNVDVTTATIIEHLHILKLYGLIDSRDNSKGKLRRTSHAITEKGKKAHMEHMEKCFKEFIEQLEKNDYLQALFFNLFHCSSKIDSTCMKPIDRLICDILTNARRPLSTLEIAKYGNFSWVTAKKHLNELLKTVQNIRTYKNGRTNMWVIEIKVK